jgi:hypothetical protein
MRTQPGEDLLRVLVRGEDRVEGVLDHAVPDHEGEPPEQGHAPGLERRQAQPLGQAQLGSESITNGSRSRSTTSRW